MATTLARRIRRLKLQPSLVGYSPKDLALVADRLTIRAKEQRRERKEKAKRLRQRG